MEVTRSPALENKAPRPEQQRGSRGAAQTPPAPAEPPRCGAGARRCRGASSLRGVHSSRLGGAATAQSLGSTTGGTQERPPGSIKKNTSAFSRAFSWASPAAEPRRQPQRGTGAGSGHGTAQARGGGHPRATGQRGRRREGSPRSHGCQTPRACSTGCCLPCPFIWETNARRTFSFVDAGARSSLLCFLFNLSIHSAGV